MSELVLRVRDCRKVNAWQYLSIGLFMALMILDYILTYKGIYEYFIITEGNPFMVFLMEMPFSQGLMVRILMALLVGSLLYIVAGSDRKYKNAFLVIAIILQFIPLTGHLMWMYVNEYMLWSVPDNTSITVINILRHMFTGTI